MRGPSFGSVVVYSTQLLALEWWWLAQVCVVTMNPWYSIADLGYQSYIRPRYLNHHCPDTRGYSGFWCNIRHPTRRVQCRDLAWRTDNCGSRAIYWDVLDYPISLHHIHVSCRKTPGYIHGPTRYWLVALHCWVNVSHFLHSICWTLNPSLVLSQSSPLIPLLPLKLIYVL